MVAVIRLVFQQFRLLGTAFKVMRYFATNQIPFPRRLWRPGEMGTLRWGSVNHSPSGSPVPYGGKPAFRTGLTALQQSYTTRPILALMSTVGDVACPGIESGQIVRVKTKQLPQEEWKVMIHASHPAYISWEEYERKFQAINAQSYCWHV